MHNDSDPRIPQEIEEILKHPGEKDFRDLFDRAAYVYIMGAFPTRLRGKANRWLSFTLGSGTSLAQLCNLGPLRIKQPIVERLGLELHPMVSKVREMLGKGYQIVSLPECPRRRPYGKIFMRRNGAHVSIHADGSVLDSRYVMGLATS